MTYLKVLEQCMIRFSWDMGRRAPDTKHSIYK
jgi:hypothetical protein